VDQSSNGSLVRTFILTLLSVVGLSLLSRQVIEGSKGTPYEGGVYHGKLLFPKEYPLKPPGVMMLTPSGRFQPNRRLCLSMSDFHPGAYCVYARRAM